MDLWGFYASAYHVSPFNLYSFVYEIALDGLQRAIFFYLLAVGILASIVVCIVMRNSIFPFFVDMFIVATVSIFTTKVVKK